MYWMLWKLIFYFLMSTACYLKIIKAHKMLTTSNVYCSLQNKFWTSVMPKLEQDSIKDDILEWEGIFIQKKIEKKNYATLNATLKIGDFLLRAFKQSSWQKIGYSIITMMAWPDQVKRCTRSKYFFVPSVNKKFANKNIYFL